MEVVLHKWMVTLSKLEKESQSLKVANTLNLVEASDVAAVSVQSIIVIRYGQKP